jgi:hypothetical protein
VEIAQAASPTEYLGVPLLRRTDPNRCPGCGERVTAFAAGCAICGADLDAWRHRRQGPTAFGRLDSAFAAFRMGPRAWRPSPGWRSRPLQLAAVVLMFIVPSCVVVGAMAGAITWGISALIP